jgi:hypothetical protein
MKMASFLICKIPECISGSNPLQLPLVRGRAKSALPLKWGKQAIRAADARIRGGWEGFESEGSTGSFK